MLATDLTARQHALPPIGSTDAHRVNGTTHAGPGPEHAPSVIPAEDAGSNQQTNPLDTVMESPEAT
jgi:hypothetical protein